MAFLDFIKNRPQPQTEVKTATKNASPEAGKPSVAQSLSPATLAKAREIGQQLSKATAHLPGNAQPTEGGSNAALLQKQNNQDKVQAPMSPTDRFNGKTALQKPSRGWER